MSGGEAAGPIIVEELEERRLCRQTLPSSGTNSTICSLICSEGSRDAIPQDRSVSARDFQEERVRYHRRGDDAYEHPYRALDRSRLTGSLDLGPAWRITSWMVAKYRRQPVERADQDDRAGLSPASNTRLRPRHGSRRGRLAIRRDYRLLANSATLNVVPTSVPIRRMASLEACQGQTVDDRLTSGDDVVVLPVLLNELVLMNKSDLFCS